MELIFICRPEAVFSTERDAIADPKDGMRVKTTATGGIFVYVSKDKKWVIELTNGTPPARSKKKIK